MKLQLPFVCISQKPDSTLALQVLRTCLLLLMIASSFRLIPLNHWTFHLLSHFPVQYGIIGIVLALLLFSFRSPRFGALAVIVACWNLSIFMDYPLISTPAKIPASAIQLYVSNICYHNDDLEMLQKEAQTLTADVALFLEVTQELYDEFQPYLPDYPYQLKWLTKPDDAGGFVLLSRFPIVSYEVLKKDIAGWMPIIVAHLAMGRQRVTLYGAHIISPLHVWNFPIRKQQFDELAAHMRKQSNPVILMGDLNTTPFVAEYQDFIQSTGLLDNRKGKGWLPSWPTEMPFFGIAIDHILTTAQLKTFAVTTGAFVGSDHFPVIAYVGFNQEFHEKQISLHVHQDSDESSVKSYPLPIAE